MSLRQSRGGSYRILEEALNNIIKHSQASVVEVSFQYKNNIVIPPKNNTDYK